MQYKRGYRDLIVWQRAIELALSTYDLVRDFPKEEIYGLTSQLKRASVSIASNIAEGSKRLTKKDFTHFLAMAYGSVAEIETQLELAKRLHFGKEEKYPKIDGLLLEVAKMLNKMTSRTEGVSKD